MQNQAAASPSVSARAPWNKGRLIGAKPPLRPKHVWTIRTKLQVEHRTRELAPSEQPLRRAPETDIRTCRKTGS